uniref:Peroxiredoxin-like 2A n=1 Tax=Plectus sambesii TaxID=2011161 RepID=A0A914WLK1_9BILA
MGVPEFKEFFDGEVFLDSEKRFYGPKERWLPLWHGVLRCDTYAHGFRAKKNGVKGNVKGEGRLLGGVFMFAPGDQGITFEHFERSWGDHAKIPDIMAAINRVKRN